MSWSYISSPPWRLRGGGGTALLYFYRLQPGSAIQENSDAEEILL
jgi:hypothetical protein